MELSREPRSHGSRELRSSQAEARLQVRLSLRKLSQEGKQQPVHFGWPLLLHPMPGAVDKMTADHPCAGRGLHRLIDAGTLISAPILPAGDEAGWHVDRPARPDLQFAVECARGAAAVPLQTTLEAGPLILGGVECEFTVEAGQELGIFGSWCTIRFMTNRTFKTGESRDQASLLPPRIEDYVEPDNPVRAIESFVCALDLAELGFRHADRGVEAMGQPPYDPADLLKLYLYGYINQIRSSRRLEREASRNLELIWLLKNLRPGYRTIANFRKENWKALKAANRNFVLLVRQLGLVGGSVVAIDGSFFHGDASKESIFTRKRLAEQIARLDLEIEAYGKSLEDTDAAEAKERTDGRGDDGGNGGDLGARVSALMAKRSRAQADLAQLKASGETQLSVTDPDARLLSKGDQTVAGYNVQLVVDDKHSLIVASEVINRNDIGHLHAMAKSAKNVLEAKELQALADEGYYSSLELKSCEDDGIVAYVPPSDGNGRLEKQGRFSRKDFKTAQPTLTVVGAAQCCVRCRDAFRTQVAALRSATRAARRSAIRAN